MAARFWRTAAPKGGTRSLPKGVAARPGHEGTHSYAALKHRADFIALRRGRKRGTPSFLLQSLPNEEGVVRLGITVTKKIGGAVLRNRIKRRFRAAAREVLPEYAAPSTDYVLIARPGAASRAWPALLDDLRGALLERDEG